MVKVRYTTCMHRGSLKDTLDTETDIDYECANLLIQTGIYRFYCFDQRIKARRYLLMNMEDRLGLPQWLHEYSK